MKLAKKLSHFYEINKNKEIFWLIISIIFSFCISFVIQNIYTKITGVIGDQEYYMGLLNDQNRSGSWLLTRTGLTFTIFKYIRAIFGTYFATYIFPLITTITMFKTIYPYWKYIPIKFFIIACFLPHFWVWQSIASKESITILASFVVVFYCAKAIYIKPNLSFKLAAIFSFIVIAFYRIHYSLSYFWILSSTILVIPNLKKDFLKKVKIKNYFQILTVVLLGIYFIFFIIYKDSTINLIETIFRDGSNYFTWTTTGKTTRWDVKFQTINDIVSNLYWGIPFSIIGFTPSEVIKNPKYLFSLIEGLLALILIPAINFKILRVIKYDYKLRFVFFYIVLPSTILALIAHYPFGIFNPGTSIRFKQNIASVIYFYPILLLMFSKTFKKSLAKKD